MRLFKIILAAVSLAVPAFAVPPQPLHTVQKFQGQTTGRYIVKLKDGVAKAPVLGRLNAKVTHDWEIINGFAGELDTTTLNALRALPDVEYISEDGMVHTMVTQDNAPWGLSRLSSTTWPKEQNDSALTFPYTYEENPGHGVDIYIVDTGIYTAHSQFDGRARWGKTFGGYADADGNGHGTHVAGTAAGRDFCVAKEANLIAVKVMSDDGSGATTDIISGMDYVLEQAKSSGRPSIVSMSLGSQFPVTALDDAVKSLTDGGVHVVVAAGNSDVPAETTSPARAPSAVTVGASTIDDAKASFSNYGSVVDIFAPGMHIISSWIGNSTATNNISGTSMATPHVTGLIAYLIGRNGNSSPAAMSKTLKEMSLKGVLKLGLVPQLVGTPDELAHNQ
ncbi:putative peptidase S8 family protein [Lyophyllum shimeji]|uniref:Peptidase S8 family protein n=1 Tax=Lyophyllum shimeji TaxID=47721 RepID=A0A9P3PX75_LYOSH|nr:putative peptidase S8 family protein [Lyophyllum shimeji]